MTSFTSIERELPEDVTPTANQAPAFDMRRLIWGGAESTFAAPAANANRNTLIQISSTQELPYQASPKIVKRPLPARKKSTINYFLDERFEGVILSVDENSFEARFVPTIAENETIEADFPIDLAGSQRHLLIPGASFRLYVGYRMVKNQRKKVSDFYIRKNRILSEEEISKAVREAEQIKDVVGWK